MNHYVAGLMFDSNNGEHVALLQGEKLNSFQDLLLIDESFHDGAARVFYNETGYPTQAKEWKPVARVEKDGFDVVYMAAVGPVRDLVSIDEDARIVVFHQDCITPDNTTPALTWLLPLARLVLQGKSKAVNVREA